MRRPGVRSARRRAPVRLSWGAAADAFLLVSTYTVLTRTTYKRNLRYASELLGDVPLAELTVEHLDALRAAVLAGRPGAKHQVLTAARTFLRWAAEHGLHPLPPEAIYEELRAPGVSRGIASFMAARRHQSSPRPGTMPVTLAAFGYTPGVAGLAQVAEEIHALREALHDADPGRWGSLFEDTEHPVNRWPGGASLPALLATLRQAVASKRRGADAFLAGLGYPEGRSGEVRLLTNLAAFAEQQSSTLGRTVWRARWLEVIIPTADELPDAP
jgi:hypothetical protein